MEWMLEEDAKRLQEMMQATDAETMANRAMRAAERPTLLGMPYVDAEEAPPLGDLRPKDLCRLAKLGIITFGEAREALGLSTGRGVSNE